MQRMGLALAASALLSTVLPAMVRADGIKVQVHKVSASGIGDKIGTITITEKGKGIALALDIAGIPAGAHGFHIHEKGSCEPGVKDGKQVAAHAAGEHYDPANTKSHRGPEGRGHKGDLPLLTATDAGVNSVISADHVALSDVRGRSIIIHAGGDTFSDNPENGGGGERIACAVIPAK